MLLNWTCDICELRFCLFWKINFSFRKFYFQLELIRFLNEYPKLQINILDK